MKLTMSTALQANHMAQRACVERQPSVTLIRLYLCLSVLTNTIFC
jgi:hypothetical protein